LLYKCRAKQNLAPRVKGKEKDMVTVMGKSGKRYEVQSQLYGTSNLVHRLYYGGIFLAGTDQPGPQGESCSTMEQTIDRADARVAALNIYIQD
jgi:hypothetical protein